MNCSGVSSPIPPDSLTRWRCSIVISSSVKKDSFLKVWMFSLVNFLHIFDELSELLLLRLTICSRSLKLLATEFCLVSFLQLFDGLSELLLLRLSTICSSSVTLLLSETDLLIHFLPPVVGGIGRHIYYHSKVHGKGSEKVHDLRYVQNEDVEIPRFLCTPSITRVFWTIQLIF